MRIFVFEDEKIRINIFHKLMKLFGATEYFITDRLHIAKDKLKSRDWDVAFLDHDIGKEKYTGCDVAKFIASNKIHIPQIFIHSMNPIGAQNIKNHLPHAVIKPFSEIFDTYEKELRY